MPEFFKKYQMEKGEYAYDHVMELVKRYDADYVNK